MSGRSRRAEGARGGMEQDHDRPSVRVRQTRSPNREAEIFARVERDVDG